MLSTVSSRHGDLDPSLRDRTETVLARLAGFAPQAVEAAVIFDTVPEGGWVEIKLHLPGGHILVATATEKVHRTALDRAEEKLRKQIDRAATAARRGRRQVKLP